MQRRTTVGNFDPYHKWLGLPPSKWMPNHFELLGLSIDEDDPTVIKRASVRQRRAIEEFEDGEFANLAAQIVIQIEEARNALLNPYSRREYVK